MVSSSIGTGGLSRLKQKQTQKVGKYVLGQKIGVGGFGVVRKATNGETGEDVAIKILDKAQLQLMNMTSQIKREITLLTTLKHPNIVNGFEVLNSPAKLYMVMEFVDGGDMHSLISERRRIPEDEAQRYFFGLINCLAYCHEQGVTHRDLKLENLLISRAGDLKVCDFGLASVRALNSDPNQLCSTIVGTEDFAAPEILQQIPYSGEQADMWSAGIILYTMLAGYCPFRGEDTNSLFEAIKSCRYTFPSDFPNGAKLVVSRLLVPNPEKRFSARDLLQIEWTIPKGQLESVTRIREESTEQEDIIDVLPQGQRSPEFRELNGGGSPEARIGEVAGFKSQGSENSLNSSSSYLATRKQAVSTSALRKQVQQNPALLLASQTIDDFSNIYAAMRQSTTLVRDRRYRLRMYPKTFVGSEMVDWIALHTKVSRSQAIEVGDRMLQAEVFHHVCRDHTFKDEYLFYRFSEDDAENSGTLNMRQMWPSTVPPREPLIVSRNLLNSLLALIKLHQAIAKHGTDAIPWVDVDKLREDKSFFAFRMASAELQAVHLNELQSVNEKIAFLTNMYHIMILHIRIYGSRSPTDRSFLRERSQLRYNIGGANITIEDILELLGANSASGEGGYQAGYSSNKLSPKTVLASPNSSPKALSTRVGVSSLFTGLSRRTDSVTSVFNNLRLSVGKDSLLPLHLNDGSPSAISIRVFGENDIVKEALELNLVRCLLRDMRVDTKRCSLHLPNVMVALRKRTNIYGERELCVEISRLFGAYLDAHHETGGVLLEEARAENEKASILRADVLGLLSSGIPVHIEFDDYDDINFAPYVEVIDGIEG